MGKVTEVLVKHEYNKQVWFEVRKITIGSTNEPEEKIHTADIRKSNPTLSDNQVHT